MDQRERSLADPLPNERSAPGGNEPECRRAFLASLAGGAAGCLTAAGRAQAQPEPAAAQPLTSPAPFFCLNTSTIRGQQLTLAQEIDVAAQAGYRAIEPWLREIEPFAGSRRSLHELKQRLDDAGLTVPSAIAFSPWIVDDPTVRLKGVETMKRDMELVQSLGGTRIAAPPVGATDHAQMDLLKIAERYRAILDLGRSMGVVPQLELWGFSRTLSRLGEVLFVAAESGHPDACVLLDIYHIYKGGSDFQGLRLVNARVVPTLHMNDYPGNVPRETISDADRVYPGEGAAPIDSILRTLRDAGFAGALSLELFNREYWRQDALEVARHGLACMRQLEQPVWTSE